MALTNPWIPVGWGEALGTAAEAVAEAEVEAAAGALTTVAKMLAPVTAFGAVDAVVVPLRAWNKLVNGSVDVEVADRNVGLVALGVDKAELDCRVTGLFLIGSKAMAVCGWILIRHTHRHLLRRCQSIENSGTGAWAFVKFLPPRQIFAAAVTNSALGSNQEEE
jgi:hypothetical protein